MPHHRRHRPSVLAVAGLLAVGLTTPLSSRAAEPTPEQATQLEGQIRAWLAGLLGPTVTLSPQPVHVAPEGDHYRLSIPVAPSANASVVVTAEPITASVKPIDGTRWSVDDLRLPSPLRVETTGAARDRFRSISIKIADQSAKGVVDLGMATTSTLEGTLRGYTSITETAQGTQTTHLDGYVSHTTAQPGASGRLNLLADGQGTGLTTDSLAPDGTPVKLAAAGFTFTAHADDVAIDQVGTVIRGMTDLAPILGTERAARAAVAGGKAVPTRPGPDAPGNDDHLPPAARAPLHAMLAAAQGMMRGMEEEVHFKDLAFDVGGHLGTLAGVAMGLGFGAPDGRIDVHMAMAIDGLDSPEIPPGVFRDYIPKHVSVRPRVSGVPTADVVALLRHAIDSDGRDGDALANEAMGLLAKGPLSIGIDDLAFDAGPAVLKGTGAMQITDPQTVAGTAQLRVTGYDALLRQTTANPMLRQAGPVMIFLKGIGKQDGDAVVWNIAYQDKKLLVNGTDLSAMLPGDGK